DVVAGPRLVDAGITIDEAALRRVAVEDRHRVVIDARVEEKRAEDFRTVLDPDGERAVEIADVGVALDVVRAAAVAAHGPLRMRQHLGRGDEPNPRVAEERRRRWTRGLARRGRRL